MSAEPSRPETSLVRLDRPAQVAALATSVLAFLDHRVRLLRRADHYDKAEDVARYADAWREIARLGDWRMLSAGQRAMVQVVLRNRRYDEVVRHAR